MSFPRYEQYKDSGAGWLGEVPDHWGVRRVRRLFEIRKRICGEEGYEVLSITQQGIKPKDIQSGDGQLSADYSKYQFVEVGDFAMNHMDLLTGYVDVSTIFGVTSPDYRVFASKDKQLCFDRYYLYLFQAGYRSKIFFAFGQGSSQLGRWRLPTDEFNAFELPCPPIEEQRQIAAVLDGEIAKIDALVAEQQRLIELLKEKRQAIISHAVTKGLNPDAPMKASGIEWLGQVPLHWRIKRLKHLSNTGEAGIQMGPFGSMLTSLPSQPTGFGLFGQRNTISGNFESCYRWISAAQYTQLSQYALRPGDIVLTRKGSIGHAQIIPANIQPGIMDSDTIRIRPNQEEIANTFLVRLLHEVWYLEVQIDAASRGAILLGLNSSTIGQLQIAVPPPEEQCAISAHLDETTKAFDSLMSQAHSAIALLHERRTALISAAVTGKIDVRGLAKDAAA